MTTTAASSIGIKWLGELKKWNGSWPCPCPWPPWAKAASGNRAAAIAIGFFIMSIHFITMIVKAIQYRSDFCHYCAIAMLISKLGSAILFLQAGLLRLK
jgi:hypothetical protein